MRVGQFPVYRGEAVGDDSASAVSLTVKEGGAIFFHSHEGLQDLAKIGLP